MEKFLHIYNGFGINPTNTFISAGTDYYIPYIDHTNVDMVNRAYEAFSKSYGLSIEDINSIENTIYEMVQSSNVDTPNIIHLYLALGSRQLEDIREKNGNIDQYCPEDLKFFIENYLVFDDNGKPGVCVEMGDTLFINSGIKIALNPNDAGLYVNKSGMGNKGWDVRAQLVDEDYSGYVHLSCAFTKNTKKTKPRTVYCGDKITQMMIVEVKHYKNVYVTEDSYNDIMAESQRGSKGFGSSDVKH